MGSVYGLSAYNPQLQRRVIVCSSDSLWEVFKAYRRAKKEGLKYPVFTWWVGR